MTVVDLSQFAIPDQLDHQGHANTDLHLIGEHIGPPTAVSAGAGNTVGTSLYPAREDHSHGSDAGTAFPTTGLDEGRTFTRTDQGRTYVYTGGSWWRLSYYTGSGRYISVLARVATQSIANATDVDISWDTEITDSESSITVPITNIACPNERVSNTLGGVWRVWGFVVWSAAPGAASRVSIIHSSGDTYEFSGNNGSNSLYRAFVLPGLLFTGAETFKIQVRQNSGGSLTLTGKIHFGWVAP